MSVSYLWGLTVIMYADFEAVFKLIEGPTSKPESSYTKEINKHIPSGFCVYSKFACWKVENPVKLYRGEDCVEVLCNYISNEARRLCDMFPEKPMKPLTRDQCRKFSRATTCHICLKEYKRGDIKVRDHCHYTGEYRAPAHSNCNLRYKTPHFISIVFHNLRGYDAHLFIRELGKRFNTGKIDVIAENKEKYISFNVDVVKLKIQSNYLQKEFHP